jgi:hypothetical protein
LGLVPLPETLPKEIAEMATVLYGAVPSHTPDRTSELCAAEITEIKTLRSARRQA